MFIFLDTSQLLQLRRATREVRRLSTCRRLAMKRRKLETGSDSACFNIALHILIFISLCLVGGSGGGSTSDFFFTEQFLHNISTHPVYNHKTRTLSLLFLHGVKNKTTLQACFFTVSIQINLYILCLFLNIICRQNIQTNHQRNMQHPEHKLSNNY